MSRGIGCLLSRPSHDPGKRSTLEVFHYDDRAPGLFEDFVSLYDVRMIEARSKARFVQKHAPKFRFARELGFQKFENHEFIEAARAARDGKIHVGRSTLAELRQETVLAMRPVFFIGKAEHRLCMLMYRA